MTTSVSSQEGVGIGFGRLVMATARALLVDTEGYGEVWIPRSAIHSASNVYDKTTHKGEVVVAKWWAEKVGYL